MEIERKWLLRFNPQWNEIGEQVITNFYLPIKGKNVELRVRKVQNLLGTKYFFTVKSKGKLNRLEKEEEIDLQEFMDFVKQCPISILKLRNSINYGQHTIHYDYFPTCGFSTSSPAQLRLI